VVVAEGLKLRHRLSSAAAAELQEISQLLADVSLGDSADKRTMAWGPECAFSSRAAYKMMAPGRVVDASACIAWNSSLPTKVKIFVYLLAINRLSTRSNLFAKHCALSADCAGCNSEETARHLFFDCARAAAVWAALGVHVPDGEVDIWSLTSPIPVAASAWHATIAVVLWHVWEARNDVVFNSLSCSPADVLRRSCADIAVWIRRFKTEDRADIGILRGFLLSVVV
jgi:hypothetical protein